MWAHGVSTSALDPIFSKVPGELHIKQLQSFQPTIVVGLEMGGFLYCGRQDLNSGMEELLILHTHPPTVESHLYREV